VKAAPEKEPAYWERNDNALCCLGPASSLRLWCRSLYKSSSFEGFILGTIGCNSLFMAFERPGIDKESPEYIMMQATQQATVPLLCV